MKELFPYFYQDEEFDFEPLWQNAIFAFDTNVLLNLFAYHAQARQEWLEVLKKLGAENRLFMPFQVAYEYHLGLAGRVDRARKVNVSSSDLRCELHSVNELFKNTALVHSKEVVNGLEKKRMDAQKRITAIVQKFESELSSEVESWKKQFESDWMKTRNSLADAFSDCSASAPSASTICARCDDAERRYVQNIPPGYKDAAKREADFGNQYGDALIWFELLDVTRQTGKPLIFVTFDSKGDWWDKSREGHLKARKELVNEMLVKSGVVFHLSTAKRFADWMQSTSGATQATSEVERVEEEQSPVINVLTTHLGQQVVVFSNPNSEHDWNALSSAEKHEILLEIDKENFLGRQNELEKTYRVDVMVNHKRIAVLYRLESADVVHVVGLRNVPFFE